MANTDPVADTAGVVEQVWRLGREGGLLRRAAGRRRHRRARRRAARRARRDGRLRRRRAGVLRRRQLRLRRRADAPGAGVRQGVRRRHRPARPGAAAHRGRPDERGRRVRRARPAPAGPPSPRRRSSPATCLLAEHVGSRLHVCHLSTAGSVEIIRWAKRTRLDVTAEVTPHHLLLTDDLVAQLRPALQGQPAAAHHRRRRCACATAWPTARSTSSRPTTRPTRPRTRSASGQPPRSGMLGLETALSVVQQTMVDTGLLDLGAGRDRMSASPAAIGRVADHGRRSRWVSRPTSC